MDPEIMVKRGSCKVSEVLTVVRSYGELRPLLELHGHRGFCSILFRIHLLSDLGEVGDRIIVEFLKLIKIAQALDRPCTGGPGFFIIVAFHDAKLGASGAFSGTFFLDT